MTDRRTLARNALTVGRRGLDRLLDAARELGLQPEPDTTMHRPLPPDHPDRRFCGTCGNPIHGKRQDPYTGDLLVEVEVHAIPDDVAEASAEDCTHPEIYVMRPYPDLRWCSRCGALAVCQGWNTPGPTPRMDLVASRQCGPCGVADPLRPGVACVLPVGHDGAHSATSETLTPCAECRFPRACAAAGSCERLRPDE